MWKRRNPDRLIHKSQSETSIERRDKTLRSLVDELVTGTQELKSLLYPGEPRNDQPNPT